MAKKKVGKDQVDLEPIGIAIDEAVAGLKKLKATGTLTRKQKAVVGVKVFKLGLLRKLAEFECCDQQWFCPLSRSAKTAIRRRRECAGAAAAAGGRKK